MFCQELALAMRGQRETLAEFTRSSARVTLVHSFVLPQPAVWYPVASWTSLDGWEDPWVPHEDSRPGPLVCSHGG